MKSEMRYARENWESISSQNVYFVKECASIIGVMARTVVNLVNRRDRAWFWEEDGASVGGDASLRFALIRC